MDWHQDFFSLFDLIFTGCSSLTTLLNKFLDLRYPLTTLTMV